MKSIILALALLATLATGAAAESSFGMAWNPSIPVGDTADFAGGFAWRGASVEWRNFIRTDWAWGVDLGWNVMTDSFSGTVTEGDITVTGNEWNTINAIPVHLTTFKYFGGDRREPRWYAGLGAGANWMEYRQDFGIFAVEETQWHFTLAPEIGVQMPWNSWVGYLGVRYQHAFAAGNVDNDQGWFDFKVGFGLN